MSAFLVRRLLTGLLLVAVLTFLTFFVFNTIPTNPACLVVACGPHTTTNDADIRAADHRLGIDRSVFVQYGNFVWRLVRHGDLGQAWTGGDVGQSIGRALPETASLVGGGMVLMLLLALPLGCLAALRPRSATDRSLLALSVVGLAVHPFVLGITLRDFFATHLGIQDTGYCPLGGSMQPGGCGGPVDWASHLAVPWFVFALFFLPLYMRMVRVRLLETFSEPWISTARAKGASETRVVLGHALRNAIGPVIPLIAIDAGTAITAAIYIETVFGLQGLGLLAVQALSGQYGGYDLPLTAGIVATVGGFVVILNVAADATTAWLDPRVRTRSAAGLIPLPHAISSRPRARRALAVAAAAAAAAALALVAVIAGNGGKNATSNTVDLGTPVRTFQLNWDDTYRLVERGPPRGHGYLETRVTQIEIGPDGWRVHATIGNRTPVALPVNHLGAASFVNAYPRQGMSLLVRTPSGYGGNSLEPLAADVFVPPLPKVLAAHATWRGTFAGAGHVRHGADIYVGFGQFTWDALLDPQIVSTSTAKSIVAP